MIKWCGDGKFMNFLFQRTTLAGPPEIVVSTPACIQTCLKNGIIQAKAVQDSLSILILDEVG